jgi:hypothetical protein
LDFLDRFRFQINCGTHISTAHALNPLQFRPSNGVSATFSTRAWGRIPVRLINRDCLLLCACRRRKLPPF